MCCSCVFVLGRRQWSGRRGVCVCACMFIAHQAGRATVCCQYKHGCLGGSTRLFVALGVSLLPADVPDSPSTSSSAYFTPEVSSSRPYPQMCPVLIPKLRSSHLTIFSPQFLPCRHLIMVKRCPIHTYYDLTCPVFVLSVAPKCLRLSLNFITAI